MIKWKIVVGGAGFGLVLSLVTGTISGVPFGILIFRAILWGVLFGCIAGALSYLISRYLPELLAIAPAGSKTDRDSGRNVDIVLPDENPHVGEAEEEAEGEYERDELDEQGTTLTRGATEADEGVSTSLVEEVEELGAEEEESGRGSPRRENQGGEAESAEELPELEGGDGMFSQRQGAVSNGDFDDISTISGGRPGLQVQGVEADPEDVAKAIRTVLKRDQKG